MMDISWEEMPIILDVSSLYAHILHDKGIIAVLCLLHKAPPGLTAKKPNAYLNDVCEMNDFMTEM